MTELHLMVFGVVFVLSALTSAVIRYVKGRKRRREAAERRARVVAFHVREAWETQRILEAQRRILSGRWDEGPRP